MSANNQPTPPKPRRRKVGLIIGIAAGVGALLIFGLPILLRAYGLEAYKIPAGSMLPTLEIGDHLFVDKSGYTPRRGDVVVFTHPKDPNKDFIKRIVALGGDTITVRNNQLLLNGAAVPQKRLARACVHHEGEEARKCVAYQERLGDSRYEVIRDLDGFPQPPKQLKLPPDHAFVLGDNRDNSFDSRFWGPVPYRLIKGKAWLIWFSSGPDGVRWDRVGRKIHQR